MYTHVATHTATAAASVRLSKPSCAWGVAVGQCAMMIPTMTSTTMTTTTTNIKHIFRVDSGCTQHTEPSEPTESGF